MGKMILVAVTVGIAVAFAASVLGVISRWGGFIVGGVTGVVSALLISRMQPRVP